MRSVPRDQFGRSCFSRTNDRSLSGEAAGAAASREVPKAPDRRTEYLAHAYACHDMALRALDAGDKRTLHGMAIVWQILAGKVLAQRAQCRSPV